MRTKERTMVHSPLHFDVRGEEVVVVVDDFDLRAILCLI